MKPPCWWSNPPFLLVFQHLLLIGHWSSWCLQVHHWYRGRKQVPCVSTATWREIKSWSKRPLLVNGGRDAIVPFRIQICLYTQRECYVRLCKNVGCRWPGSFNFSMFLNGKGRAPQFLSNFLYTEVRNATPKIPNMLTDLNFHFHISARRLRGKQIQPLIFLNKEFSWVTVSSNVWEYNVLR